MLVATGGLGVDETAGFELAGPDFRFAGVAKVTHHADQAVGLRFVSWQGQVHRSVCALISARLRRERESTDAGRRDSRVMRRVVAFIGTQYAVERIPRHGRQPSS